MDVAQQIGALGTFIVALSTAFVAVYGAIKANKAANVAKRVEAATQHLTIEINHRLTELLKVTQREAFEAGKLPDPVLPGAVTTGPTIITP